MVETAEATLDLRTTTTVEADRSRLERLFENLFRNAVEHVGPTVTVTVADTPVGFVVGDDGPGIEPTDRETVFDPGVSTATDGTGFGLYVVETIAEAHGWTVALSDAGDGGSKSTAAADSDVSGRDWSVSGGTATADGARFEFTLFPGETDGFCLSP
jgi:signal transduction histidine kinase